MKPGRRRGVHFRNVLLIQATEAKSVSSCQDLNIKRRKQRLHTSSCLLPRPCSMARFFPRGMGWSMELTDVVSSLWAPLREALATGKSTRTRKRMLAFPTNSSLSPLVWFKNLLAFSAQKSHPPQEKIPPCPPGEADPPPKGPLSVPVRPQPDPPVPPPQRPGHLVKMHRHRKGSQKVGLRCLKVRSRGMEGRGRAR